jgi:hypothetical protein
VPWVSDTLAEDQPRGFAVRPLYRSGRSYPQGTGRTRRKDLTPAERAKQMVRLAEIVGDRLRWEARAQEAKEHADFQAGQGYSRLLQNLWALLSGLKRDGDLPRGPLSKHGRSRVRRPSMNSGTASCESSPRSETRCGPCCRRATTTVLMSTDRVVVIGTVEQTWS